MTGPAHRGSEPAMPEKAVGELRERLCGAARKMLGTRGRHVEMQAESVVQSVIAEAWPRIAAERQRPEDAYGLLLHMLRNRVKDRGRKRSVRDRVGGGNAEEVRARSETARPATQGSEASGQELRLTAALHKRLGESLGDEIDVRLCDLCLLRGVEGARAGEIVGLTAMAVRARLSRMRPRILKTLFEPLRARVNGTVWAVAEEIADNRLSSAAIAERLLIEEHRVLELMAQSIIPLVSAIHGDCGLLLVRACATKLTTRRK